MKLSDARKHYYELSGLASNSARQLAFAGIAVVWILASDNRVIEVSTLELRAPLLAFVVALALDLLQYYAGAAFWGGLGWLKENQGKQEFKGAPSWGNWVPIVSFWSKGLAVAYGYGCLMTILWPVMFAQ